MTRREIEGWTVDTERRTVHARNWTSLPDNPAGGVYVSVGNDGVEAPPEVLAAVLPDEAMAAELRSRGYHPVKVAASLSAELAAARDMLDAIERLLGSHDGGALEAAIRQVLATGRA